MWSSPKLHCAAKVSKGFVERFDTWIASQNLERTVGATAVDDHDPRGPVEFRQRAGDIRQLVESEHQRGDVVHPHQLRARARLARRAGPRGRDALGHPAPSTIDDDIQTGVARRPIQGASRKRGVGDQGRRIALATGRGLDGDGAAGDALGRGDHILDAGTLACPEIVGGEAGVAAAGKRRDVGGGEVGDMDVVPNAGSVRRVVILAVDLDVRFEPERGLKDKGQQVRLGIMLLTDLAIEVGASGVEIAQGHHREREGGGPVAKDVFRHQLRAAIRAHGTGRWSAASTIGRVLGMP